MPVLSPICPLVSGRVMLQKKAAVHLANKLQIVLLILITLCACGEKSNRANVSGDLQSMDLLRGDIALCGEGVSQFGNVEFSLSCNEAVRENFNLAMALLHSFEYDEAEKAFAKVIDEDPACAMAYWGVAMSNFHTLWEPPTQDDLEKGLKAIEIAQSLEETSPRELQYIQAMAAFYLDWEKLDHRTRSLKFEKEMEKIYQKFPDDKEAAIFYALVLNATANPSDKTYTHQKKAGTILNKLFSSQSGHPGIAHYIIHNYDYPELAVQALEAARRYAAIAPASAHAQHMPSHIFTRLGFWEESITSNLTSISAAQCYADNVGMEGHWDEELHGMDYLVYAYLQKAQDDKAKAQVDYLKTIHHVYPENFKVAYAMAAIPARFALERKQWEEAAQLTLPSSDFPFDQFPWQQGITYFARVLGAVHTGDKEEAQANLEVLKSCHSKLVAAKDDYKAKQVLIQIKASEAWIQFEEGREEEALELMISAADMEDATEKHPVTPGAVVPARELLGELLLEMDHANEALQAFETSMKRAPNRFNGLLGAAQAADRIGDKEKAMVYYDKLVELADESNPERPSITAAKTFLENNRD